MQLSLCLSYAEPKTFSNISPDQYTALYQIVVHSKCKKNGVEVGTN